VKKKKNIILLMLVLALIFSVGLYYKGDFENNSKLANKDWSGDKFEGETTNVSLLEETYYGTITYDENCVSVGNSLTNCDAGIKNKDLGEINFNYTHNMSKKPCLTPEENVKIINKNGVVTVVRENV